jgi:hypothetical protein
LSIVEVGVAWGACVREALSDIAPDGEVLAAPEFAGLWSVILQQLTDVAPWAVLGEVLVTGLRPAVSVLSSTHVGAMRVLSDTIKQSGSQTIVVHHSGFNMHASSAANINWGAEDLFAVWGALDGAYVRSGGPKANAVEIGILRDDVVSQPCLQERVQGDSVVLMTGGLSFFRYHSINLSKHISILRSFFRTMSTMKRRVLLRVHPSRDFPDLYLNLAAKENCAVEMASGLLSSELSQCRVAVMVSHLSTVAAEAISLGVPVLLLRWATRSSEHFGLEDVGAVQCCETLNELETELERLFTDDEYHGQMLARQRAGLQRAIVAHGDEAVDRMLALMDELGQEARPGPVDPWARWILDVLQFMDHWVQGGLSKSECQARYRTLREQGRRCAPGEYRYLDAARLPGEYMRMCIWRNAFARSQNVSLPDAEADENAGACGRVPNRVRMVWKIGRLFPAAMRPALRPYVVQALLEEASEAAPDRVLYRKFMQTMALILAPGRLFRS